MREVYDRLIAIKREEVIADIQAAMGEIHQNANISKKDIVEKADTAFTNSKNTAAAAESLTALDAMKIRISSTRQQYLQKLIVEEKTDVDTRL